MVIADYEMRCASLVDECYHGFMNPNAKGRCARNGEIVNAELAEGRTCLGECGLWKDKSNFRVVPKTGNLFAYCHACMNKRNTDRWHAEKSKPDYRARRYELNQTSKAKLKQDVITAYGGKCACCGESTVEFLTLDHKNNDGAEHREAEGLSTGSQTWAYARKHDYPDIFQLLCFNCNCAKGAYGYCPHQQQP